MANLQQTSGKKSDSDVERINITRMPVNEDIVIGDQVRNGGLKVGIKSAGLLNGETGEVRGQKVEIFSKVMWHGHNTSKGRCSQQRWKWRGEDELWRVDKEPMTLAVLMCSMACGRLSGIPI